MIRTHQALQRMTQLPHHPPPRTFPIPTLLLPGQIMARLPTSPTRSHLLIITDGTAAPHRRGNTLLATSMSTSLSSLIASPGNIGGNQRDGQGSAVRRMGGDRGVRRRQGYGSRSQTWCGRDSGVGNSRIASIYGRSGVQEAWWFGRLIPHVYIRVVVVYIAFLIVMLQVCYRLLGDAWLLDG